MGKVDESLLPKLLVLGYPNDLVFRYVRINEILLYLTNLQAQI